MKPKTLLLGLMLIFYGVISAQKITLAGSAKGYEGSTLVFYAYTDYVSFTEKKIMECKVDSNSLFSGAFDAEEITSVAIETGIYRCNAYLVPGMSYTVIIPTKNNLLESDKLNPYFKPNNLPLLVYNENDIDSKISKFDSVYFNFLDKDFEIVYFKYGINGINKFAARADSIVPSAKNDFVSLYKEYKVAGLKQMARPVNKKLLVKNYLNTKPILYDNPAYFEFISAIYRNYFIANKADSVVAIFTNYLLTSTKFNAADSLFIQIENITNKELRQLIYIVTLHDGFYNNSVPKGKIIEILEFLQKTTEFVKIRELCLPVIEKLKYLSPGTIAPDFLLFAPDGLTVNLKSFKGKFVYLNFQNTNNFASVQDLELLKNLHNKFFESLKIVTVITDFSMDNIILSSKENKYQWVFLHYSNQPDVLKKYEVKVYPCYFLISPEGLILWSPAPTPQEDFENKFIAELQSYQREQVRKNSKN